MALRVAGKGIFITLEGPDGAGKSVQAGLLAERLRSDGHEVVVTREPGGTPLGEHIRALLLDAAGDARDPLPEAMLFSAARRQLVEDVIRPALGRGAVVVCDRYADSTMAYQGFAGGAPLDELRALADIATGGLRPDRTVLLDLPVDAGLARRSGGEAAQLTRFEVASQHDRSYHERVRRGYLDMAAADPARWRVVNASDERGPVSEAVWEAVADLLAG